MKENERNKREWVKTAAIVFLTVMLILTFFSNTIMNYSLPEVATQYVQSGTITAKIRGSGMVESGDPYNVEVKESRKVSEVAVRTGTEVQKGDILIYLEDAESEELKTAAEALKAAKDAYDAALLNSELTAADILAANNHTSTNVYRQRLTSAQNAVTAAENEQKASQKRVDELQALKDEQDAANKEEDSGLDNNANITDAEKAYNVAKEKLEEAELALKRANLTLAEKNNVVNTIKAAISLEDVSSNNLSDLNRQLAEAERTAFEAENRVRMATQDKEKWSLEFEIREKALKEEKGTDDDTALDKELKLAKADLESKNAALEEKQNAMAELAGQITRSRQLEKLQADIEKAQELVDDLTADSIGATITAPISGTVTTINVKAGETTPVSGPVVVMQPEGKGYTLSFSVTNDQAKSLSVGDQADLVNAWRYDDVTVTLASIKPDTQDPGQKKLLTFDVSGSVTPGQNLSVSVGQKSASYDYIVPNSAIREDNNGKFILIVEQKSSPLGTRYVASRVDVEVIASDDTQSAVNGALYGYEYVITTSTKPVQTGNLIRLADN